MNQSYIKRQLQVSDLKFRHFLLPFFSIKPLKIVFYFLKNFHWNIHTVQQREIQVDFTRTHKKLAISIQILFDNL